MRTVGIERIDKAGVDFVVKRGSMISESLASGHPVAFMYQQGRFLPGENAEQWRGEGSCDQLKLGEVLDLIPHFVVTSMVASTRIAAEESEAASSEGVSPGRLAMMSKSHVTEIMQKTRVELENGDISMEILEKSIAAYRFIPNRMECMLGGPDAVMWDRWEWLRDADGDAPKGTIAWAEPRRLIPH